MCGTITDQSFEAWRALWSACHASNGGLHLRAWPYDGALVKQPAIVIQVFSVITEMEIAEAQSG